MDKTKICLKNVQLLGISYFSGKAYYKTVRTGVIIPETSILLEELQTQVT